MKRIIFILTTIIITACDQPNNSIKTVQNYTDFDLFVKRFKAKNSTMWTNDITRDEGNQKFKKQVLAYFNDSLGVSKIPLSVRSINKLGDGYVVHLENNDNYKRNDISQNTHIDIFALVKEEIARPLVQGDTALYFITKYKKVRFLTNEMRHIVTGDMVWGADVDLIAANDTRAISGSGYGN